MAGVDDGQVLPDSATVMLAFLARGGPAYPTNEPTRPITRRAVIIDEAWAETGQGM